MHVEYHLIQKIFTGCINLFTHIARVLTNNIKSMKIIYAVYAKTSHLI